MKKFVFFFFLLSLFVAKTAFAQQDDDFRRKNILFNSMIIKIDTLSIKPQSFSIQNVSDFKYFLDPVSSTLYLLDSNLLSNTYFIEYQVFPKDYSKPVFHKSSSIIENPRPYHQILDIPVVSFSDVINNDALYTNGSLARGVSVGNNQDLVLNSSLNLQLSGKLSDDIEVSASISDKNIPIQPEGNTQFIQDINSIFISVKIKNIASITAGDIVSNLLSDNFLRYNRSFLGLSSDVYCFDYDKIKINNSLGGGIAKGKFARQSLTVQNGVQGPYKLYGNNNEIAISVVSGSERVYLDGQLLTRGQDNDYTIDYNTSEITFTPKILVTQEKRFVVEFEYSDRHFVRYAIFSNNEFQLKNALKTKFFVNFYHESDLKNQSIQPELSNEHKLFLSQIGDDENPLFSYFDTVAYNANQIQYKKTDTLYNNIVYSIYKICFNKKDTLYSPSFTYMGTNKGNYILSSNSANGRVFEWIPPIDGVPQGDYEPFLSISTPTAQQMLTLGFDSKISNHTNLFAEFALSNQDKNLFSKLNDDDNIGFSYLLKIKDLETFSSKKDSLSWKLLSDVSLQYINKNFTSFESFRDVEFARNFNLASDFSKSHSEWMFQTIVNAYKSDFHNLKYILNLFLRQNDSKAIRNEFSTDDNWKKWYLKTNSSLLVSKDSIQKSEFLISKFNLSRKNLNLEYGIDNLFEYNKFIDNKTSLLRQNSYSFNESNIFLKSLNLKNHSVEVLYKFRTDFAPKDTKLQINTIIHEVKSQYKIINSRNHNFSTNLTYRFQQLFDSTNKTANEHYFVGNLSYTARFLKNVIIWSSYYEAGSGLEQKKSFSYIKVAKGQGTHIWNDYNGNGIEEIDEFEIAAFADQAEYVKVWILGNDYKNVYNNSLTQSLLIRPAAIWSNKNGWRKFLSRFSNTTNFRTNLKHEKIQFLPFSTIQNDTNTIASLTNFSNNFSFNNNTSKFAFEIIVQRNTIKQFLYYGFETSSNNEESLVLKSLPVELLFLQISINHKQMSNLSTFVSRNYDIVCYNLNGEIRFQYQNKHISSISGSYGMKANSTGLEKINLLNLELSYTYRLLNRGTIYVSAQYVDISGNAGDNSSVSYNLLSGLSLGRNFIWNADIKFSITDYLQISAQYNGRAIYQHPIVHSGLITISAMF